MVADGNAYREDVLNGTTDPTKLPKDLRESLAALKTKKVGGIPLTPDLYTGVTSHVYGREHNSHHRTRMVESLEIRRGREGGWRQRSHYRYAEARPSRAAWPLQGLFLFF